MSRRTISVFGATGSIGESTLDLVRRNPDQFEVLALTAHSNVHALAQAARATQAKRAVIADEAHLTDLKAALAGTGVEVAAGREALVEAASLGADWTMAAIVGCAGLAPAMAALKTGKTLALANKESLVSAGDLMMSAAKTAGATLLTVDSEHNAIFQCMDATAPKAVRRIILTASGGPFREFGANAMATVTPDMAVKHPNWDMGAKISVDSATMMNKGLEVIEAHHLFGLPSDRIDVLVHPQSVIHSMVEYVDGSVLAQLGTPDMRTPIAHALAWPERMETPVASLNLAQVGRLDFEEPDPVRFPALRLARVAMEAGGAAPAILNAANEIAVAAFLDRRVGFTAIAAIVERVMERYEAAPPASIEEVLAVDSEARRISAALIESEFA
ncbi:MAG: 1-deoxy-D-xylulose-5-phosphate reductoisomerase [Sphingomonadales bacterium]|jgi:1-deoxy-D-xylulose-5-phosphate reductoisomerase|nr:1-deoxy-D-xylulose-5-phosphate reductoisomerase [Sphingomonadales bacterium]